MKVTIIAEGYFGKVTAEFDFKNVDGNTRTVADSCIADVLNAAGVENDEAEESEDAE